MKKILLALMAFGTVSAHGSAFTSKDLPRPCLLECNQISINLPSHLFIGIRWGKQSKNYVLMEQNGKTAPENGFSLDQNELNNKNIKLSFWYDFNIAHLSFALPGATGDLSQLPEDFRQLLVPSEDLLKINTVSNKDKKQCWLTAFFENSRHQIEEQELGTREDTVADFQTEISPITVKINAPYENASKLGTFDLNIRVLKKILPTTPFAEIELSNKLNKLKQIGVCKP